MIPLTTSIMKLKDEIANPALYRLYHGYMLPDIAHKIGLDATPYVKRRLHEIHKNVLHYPSTAGASQEVMERFVFEVGALWACHGIFVKMKEEQENGIEWKPLQDIWDKL